MIRRHSLKHVNPVKLQYIISSPAYYSLAARAVCVITLQHTQTKVMSHHIYGDALFSHSNKHDWTLGPRFTFWTLLEWQQGDAKVQEIRINEKIRIIVKKIISSTPHGCGLPSFLVANVMHRGYQLLLLSVRRYHPWLHASSPHSGLSVRMWPMRKTPTGIRHTSCLFLSTMSMKRFGHAHREWCQHPALLASPVGPAAKSAR